MQEQTQIQPQSDKMRQALDSLNEAQRQAAIHHTGPAVVFAGAGSGKTRVITHRIALLVDSGVPAQKILAVTFTNKAAKEMRERTRHLEPTAGFAHIATFHSACTRWLREFAAKLGFTSDFSIYDDNDSLSLLRAICKELQIRKDDVSPNEYKAAISKAKTLGWLPADAASQPSAERFFPKAGLQVYRRYQEALANANAMDFNDLLLNVCLLLRRDREVLDILRRRYHYIMVDEYQDTNFPQFQLVTALTESTGNLFVVGDDDQSIYSWRGADPTNILEFSNRYRDAVQYRLEQNYRCTGNIVKAANALIQNNQERASKELWTDSEPGPLIDFIQEFDSDSEAWFIIEEIERDSGRFAQEEIAIFYRTNAQSRILEDTLRRRNIPYQIYGALRFYDRAEIKDMLAFLRLVVNPRDDIALKRVLNIPARGIGAKALDIIAMTAQADGASMLEGIAKLSQEAIPRLSGKLKAFMEFYEGLKAELAQASLNECVSIVMSRTGYSDYLKKKFPQQQEDKLANALELSAAMSDYEESNPDATLSSWLADISLMGSEEQSEGGVTLMTLHSAKGLEFDRVFIAGFEDGLTPHSNSLDNKQSVEEERRLVYVGITRARKKLTLASAARRRMYNTWHANNPSRFLREIPRDVLEISGSQEVPEIDIQEEAFHLRIGGGVVHPAYGRGVVKGIDEELGGLRVTVYFPEHGMRRVSGTQLETI